MAKPLGEGNGAAQHGKQHATTAPDVGCPTSLHLWTPPTARPIHLGSVFARKKPGAPEVGKPECAVLVGDADKAIPCNRRCFTAFEI